MEATVVKLQLAAEGGAELRVTDGVFNAVKVAALCDYAERAIKSLREAVGREQIDNLKLHAFVALQQITADEESGDGLSSGLTRH
jgi:hypothetical protein